MAGKMRFSFSSLRAKGREALLVPEKPRDAAYFHMPDPDGHQLSFARPI